MWTQKNLLCIARAAGRDWAETVYEMEMELKLEMRMKLQFEIADWDLFAAWYGHYILYTYISNCVSVFIQLSLPLSLSVSLFGQLPVRLSRVPQRAKEHICPSACSLLPSLWGEKSLQQSL